jgi:hypothetical protein
MAPNDLSDVESDCSAGSNDSVFCSLREAFRIRDIVSSPQVDIWLANVDDCPRDDEYEARYLEPDPNRRIDNYRLPCKNAVELGLCMGDSVWLPGWWHDCKGHYICTSCDMSAPQVREGLRRFRER